MSAAVRWLRNAFPALHAAQVARAYRRVFGRGEQQLGTRASKLDSENRDARLILDDLALYCSLRRTGFVPGAPDQTAFNEGQRDVLLHLLSMAEVPADALLQPTQSFAAIPPTGQAFDSEGSAFNDL